MASLNGRVNEEFKIEDDLIETSMIKDKNVTVSKLSDTLNLSGKVVTLPDGCIKRGNLENQSVDETKLSYDLNLRNKNITLPDGCIEGRNIDNIFDISNKSTVNLPPACITANNLSYDMDLSSKNVTLPDGCIKRGNLENLSVDHTKLSSTLNLSGKDLTLPSLSYLTISFNLYVASGDFYVYSGDIYAYNGTVIANNFINNSDRRIKKDIQDLTETECIDIIDRLKPKKFKMKDDIDQKQKYGFIGQEYKEILPDSVYLNEREIDGEKVTDFHSIDQNSLISILVKNIQYLNKIIKELNS